MSQNSSLEDVLKVIQSTNINFLLGAGVSTPFIETLGDIEDNINKATTDEEKVLHKKEYFEKVMLPNLEVIETNPSPTDNCNYKTTTESYNKFFSALWNMVFQRKSTILNKQINLFTTNIDVLMETTLERLSMEYNDGFSGKFQPTFDPVNYKKSIHQRSLHFDYASEIPVFNIVKLHGSLTWFNSVDTNEIKFSHTLEHIEETKSNLGNEKFEDSYKKILIVNPELVKYSETVLNLYYHDLLRMYSSELEKENTTLFVLGFSMNDQHIREITKRASKSNPTLRVFVCCSNSEKEEMGKRLTISKYQNIKILTPSYFKSIQKKKRNLSDCLLSNSKSSEKFSLECLTKNILEKYQHYK